MTQQYPDWANDQLMKDYYDHHWGLPVHDEQELFEMLTLETFQAGLSWATVWKKRTAFEQAFANFAVDQVAQFGEQQVKQLMQDPGIIRNRRKIEAAIHNARVLHQYHQAGKTLDHFLWSFVNGHPIRMQVTAGQNLPSQTPLSQKIAKELKTAGFKFVGPTTIFSLLCAVGIVNARS